MDITFDNNKIRKKCNKATDKFGKRLDDMRAAENLEVMETLPGNCHALKADKKGLWAIHIDEPYRLIFRPANDPLPVSKDSWLDTSKITIVDIITVENYHDK